MNEQTSIRLGIITSRFGKASGPPVDSVQAWLAAYEDLRSGVLRTAMTEIGDILSSAGHGCAVVIDAEPSACSIDLVVTPWGAADKQRRVRFFTHRDPHRGQQIVAHVWLQKTPAEMTRFERPEEVTPEVAEQVLVDALEQIFASAASQARREQPGHEPHEQRS